MESTDNTAALDAPVGVLQPEPRKPWVALMLSLLTPGVGQVYNGQPKKGMVLFALLIAAVLIAGPTHLIHNLYGLTMLFCFEIGTRLYLIIDAIVVARKRKEYYPAGYNRWYVYLVAGVMIFWISWQLNAREYLGVQTFNIPTTSNYPTLQVGDILIADMNYYKDNPVGIGDMVVYYKPDGLYYIHRVVALPGDSLELRNNAVVLNGRESKLALQLRGHEEQYATSIYTEKMSGGKTHYIQKYNLDTLDVQQRHQWQQTDSIRNYGPHVVPKDHYFLMGDNRDNALDSRYVGAISGKNIAGKALYIYWSNNPDRINTDLR